MLRLRIPGWLALSWVIVFPVILFKYETAFGFAVSIKIKNIVGSSLTWHNILIGVMISNSNQ